MKIAYLTQFDAKNILSWSGSGFNIAKCLQDNGAEVDFVGPLKNSIRPTNVAQYLLNTKILKTNDHPQRDPSVLKSYGRQGSELLRNRDADVVFAPGGLPLAYLKTALPKVLWTDCTFATMLDYYPSFSNLSKRTVENGHAGERLTLHNCDLLLFTSDWAARSAVDDYGVAPSKVKIVPFGSNMAADATPAEVEDLVARRVASLGDTVRLFCSGVDWYRKGIDIAVEVAQELTRQAIRCELVIAGCSPPPGTELPDYVKVVGFISKNDAAGLQVLSDYYRKSHILLVPTRAECYGLVFCEAASFALPSITTDTGGTRSAMGDGDCGALLAPTASTLEWAQTVAALVRDPASYEAACRSAYAAYRDRLNWTAAGQMIMPMLATLRR